MKLPIIILIFYTSISCGQLPNLLNTPDHKCLKCICTSITGNNNLRHCTMSSMTIRYWRNAGSPKINNDFSSEIRAFQACMANDNCVIHTLNKYTTRNKAEDCNCDGVFDCQDKFLLHFDKCYNPFEIKFYEERLKIFRKCMGNREALMELCAGEDY